MPTTSHSRGFRTGKISLVLWIFMIAGLIGPFPIIGRYVDIGPDPLEWRMEPHSFFSSEVRMSVRPLPDLPDAEYLFECIEGPGKSSGWRKSSEYTDSGLTPATTCVYTARVRNAKSGIEMLPAAGPVSVTTRRRANSGKTRFMPEIDRAFARGEIELIPIRVTGDKDNRINFCVINRWVEGAPDGYNSPERRQEFIEDVRHAFRTFRPGDEYAIDPFPEYRDFFNLYAVWWPGMPAYEWEKGFSPADLDEIRDRLFLPWRIEGRGWVSCLAMLNTDKGGGGAARNIETRTGNAMIAGRETEAFIHEFSHTAPGLPDEYTANGVWGRGAEGSNTTLDFIRENIKWKAWIEPGTPVPTPYSVEYRDKIGVFEGATHRLHHIFRPTARGCIMGAGSFAGDPDGLCPICRQRAVCRLYMWVNPFDSISPARTEFSLAEPGTVRFSADVIRTGTPSQKLSWYLNGRLIADGVSEIDVTFGRLPGYELECRLRDESRFIRPDPPFVDYPEASVRWTIHNPRAAGGADPLAVRLEGRNPVPGEDDGGINARVSGGIPPYLFRWEDGALSRDRRGLPPGTYRLRVSDAEFRSAEAEMRLDYPAGFAPEILSSRSGSGWRLEVRGVEAEGADFSWSNGREGRTVDGLADGRYSCRITGAEGSVAVREVELLSPDAAFRAEIAEIVPSTGDGNNGRVRFRVEGGRPPYAFTWQDGEASGRPGRDFLHPGRYSVEGRDANRSAARLDFEIASAPEFRVADLKFERAGEGKIRITDPDPDFDYLWYAEDIPDYVPEFPNGRFYGTGVTAGGGEFRAEAAVTENRGGVFIKNTAKNDFGSWIHLKLYTRGKDRPPVEFDIDTSSEGRFARKLTVRGEKTDKIIHNDNYHFRTESADITWNGAVENGRMDLAETGFLGSRMRLWYSSRYEGVRDPLARGAEFMPPAPGDYFVAARDRKSGAISLNRAGVAVPEDSARLRTDPLSPGEAKSAGLLLWLDGDDLDADGKPDGNLFRRGSANGGRSKAGDIDFHYFNYYPNARNGRPVLSWKTIWIQRLSREVSQYRTIVMVRKESDFSSPGTAPWRELDPLIGIGEYGGHLFADELSPATLNGKVWINGSLVDPTDRPMPRGFYIAVYQFAGKTDIPFQVTDGHWEGEVAEALVFDSALSDEERRGIEAYLYRKWMSGIDGPFANRR